MNLYRFATLLAPAALLAAVLVLQDPGALQAPPGAVPSSDRAVCPALVGTKVAAATVRDLEGKPLTLESIFQEKPTILVFYRGGW